MIIFFIEMYEAILRNTIALTRYPWKQAEEPYVGQLMFKNKLHDQKQTSFPINKTHKGRHFESMEKF